MSETLAEVLGEHRLHASMNICGSRGCKWRAIPDAGSLVTQHADHLATAVLAWVEARLAGARESVARQVVRADDEAYVQGLDSATTDQVVDAALDVVRAVLGVEVGS